MINKTVNYNVNNSLYSIGGLGALIYFIQHATTFWEGVLGEVKASFWPGVIV